MTAPAAIGFFDSGVGGLSVLRHALHGVSGIPLLYVADSAYAPYGARPAEQIIARAVAITGFLCAQGAEAIVVACNTATAVAIDRLRAQFTIPIIGMEPGIKPAAERSRSGQIAVLATQGTLHSGRYARLRSAHGGRVEVHERVCHAWVEAVENADPDESRLDDLVHAELAPLLGKNIDTYVLACTHFPFLSDKIASIAGDLVELIDPGPAVVKQLCRRLQLPENLLCQSPLQLFSSGRPARLAQLSRQLIGIDSPVSMLPV